MKLWLLMVESCDWDEYNGFVVRAETEAQAREFANAACSNVRQTFDDWTCQELTADVVEPGIILSSFNAG